MKIPSYKLTVLFSILFLLLFCNAATAQTTTINIKAINKKGEPIAGASIIATKSMDSVASARRVADSNGSTNLSLSTNSKYLLEITAVGYKPLQKGIAVNGKQSSFSFTMEPTGGNLNEVVIVNKKPLMRQEEDKTIVDPENIANTSTNAFEMMEKVPGLFVDQDGNIYISSTTPATVLINGRDTKMSTADVATMLKSLPPASIARIEIVRTPSAKYDASGSGGVVNVVLKKGVKIGLTGSANAGINQGRYGNRFLGFNLNNNNGKVNTYLNTQFTLRNTYDQLKTDRNFSPDSLLAQDAYTKYPGNASYLGYGVGYEISKKWELNYDGRISNNNNKNSSTNHSDIRVLSTDELLVSNVATVKNDAASFGLNQSITAKYKIDSLGSEWATDISYNYNKNNNSQLYNTNFLVPANQGVSGNGSFDNKRNFYVAQTDVKFKVPKQFSIEAGIKASLIQFNSAANFYKTVGTVTKNDAERTNSFTYRENINATYLQGTKSIKKYVLKAGVRLENTNMSGNQLIPVDTSFKINRTDAFPYVYLSRDLFKIASYPLKGYLVYRRTISRPGYDLLNPFSKFVDQYLSETGNPALRPQFTKNYEANVSFEERPVFAIGYNDTKDIFTNVIYQNDTNPTKTIRTYDNLGRNKETYMRILGALPPGGKYFFVIGGQYNYNVYNGLYENAPLTFKRASWSVFTFQTLKLGKLSTASIYGFVRFNGQQQFYELGTFGSFNASVNRQFLNKKLTVTANCSDIFFTNNNTFKIAQGSIVANGFRQADTRRFGINLRYNFGFRKKEDNNIFNTESPEKTN